MSEVPVQDFLKLFRIKSDLHVTICGCGRSPNVFRFKAMCSYKMWKSRTSQCVRTTQ